MIVYINAFLISLFMFSNFLNLFHVKTLLQKTFFIFKNLIVHIQTLFLTVNLNIAGEICFLGIAIGVDI